MIRPLAHREMREALVLRRIFVMLLPIVLELLPIEAQEVVGSHHVTEVSSIITRIIILTGLRSWRKKMTSFLYQNLIEGETL
jgi:hypothetical protein